MYSLDICLLLLNTMFMRFIHALLGSISIFILIAACVNVSYFLSVFKLLWQTARDVVAYKQQKCISYSSGRWKFKIKLPARSGEGSIPGLRHFVFSHYRRGQGALWGLLYRTTSLIHECVALMT